MSSLKKLLKPSQTATVVIGTERVLVTYRPQYMDAEFEENVLALQKARVSLDDIRAESPAENAAMVKLASDLSPEDRKAAETELENARNRAEAEFAAGRTETQMRLTRANTDLFLKIAESWDLKADDADPEPIPLSVEGLRQVPHDVIAEILAGVLNDNSPNPTAAPLSAATSPQMGTLESYPSGTPSSEPLGTSG